MRFEAGDPLSPYLFVLRMEFLGQSINKAVKEGRWKQVKTSRSGPSVSHIFLQMILSCS